MSRRNFLLVVGGGVLAGLFSSAAIPLLLGSFFTDREHGDLYKVLTLLFPDKEAAERVGYTCFSFLPEGTNVSSLVEELFDNDTALLSSHDPQQAAKEISQKLQKMHRNNLLNNEFLHANGWVFSLTEAKIYSLFYLMHGLSLRTLLLRP